MVGAIEARRAWQDPSAFLCLRCSAPSEPPHERLAALQPNLLFQERPGEFEALEKLLFGQNGSGRVGLVGVGVVGMGGGWDADGLGRLWWDSACVVSGRGMSASNSPVPLAPRHISPPSSCWHGSLLCGTVLLVGEPPRRARRRLLLK
jgi:hypothetical protein